MADHLGRDPLEDLALCLRHQRQRPVGMGLDVDEAGRDDLPGNVDHLRPARGDVGADRGDSAIFDDAGILWFTLQHSNMIGRLDPTTGEVRLVSRATGTTTTAADAVARNPVVNADGLKSPAL